MKLQRQFCCRFCGAPSEIIHVHEQNLIDWQNGMLAQDAFPYLTADEREWIMTQICPSCFESATKEDE